MAAPSPAFVTTASGARANLLALGAIGLWSSLAALGVQLAHLPPFLLTGIGLLVGSVPSWHRWREWRVAPRTLGLGVYGLFGFHFLLFIALRHAPPVEANLVNYLWPLLIVVLAPWLLVGVVLRPVHVVAAMVGFAGAALAILGGREGAAASPAAGTGELWGYLPALGSAFIWATYSLATRRLSDRGQGFPTAAIGLFGLVSGALSLMCHVLLEPPVALGLRDLLLVAAMGLGPLGAAFYLWDAALKRGDPRTIGVLSYLTPLGSTLCLVASTGRPFTVSLLLAALMITAAAAMAARAGR
jgi:drug/metabolite transporter (DMT)-like permease